MRLLRGLAIALALLLVLAAASMAWILNDRPDLERWRSLELPPAPGHMPGVTLTWLGVSTLVFDDGETTLLTDGFFTRPGLLAVLLDRPIAPDPERIAAGLALAGVERAAAVMTVHSHYDHAMDAPEVARRTGAVVVGSRSTANVARGAGLPEQRIVEVEPGRPLRYGAFTVRFVESRHVPLPGPAARLLGKPIEAPVVPPAPASAYLEGGSWSILIEHPAGSALVQGSAGFVPGALEPWSADVVLLGVGLLGRQDDAYRTQYWRELVQATGARRVIPIHWDDFTKPLDQPLVAFPRLSDDLDGTLEFLAERAQRDPAVELRFVPPLQPVELFAPAGG